jgi:hypothetical protein
MKAAVIESLGSGFTFADIDVAEPEGAEVRIDVKASCPDVLSLRVGEHAVACNIPIAGYVTTAAVAAPTSAPSPPSCNDRMATRRASVATWHAGSWNVIRERG